MQLPRSIKIPRRDLPIRSRQNPRTNTDQQENRGKHAIDLARKDEECKQRESPDQEIQRDDGVILRRRKARRIVGCRVGCCESESGELKHSEREPKDGEETHDHHGEEVAHDPFKDHCEEEEDGADEEEDPAGETVNRWEWIFGGWMGLHDGGKAGCAAPAHEDHGEGEGGDDEAGLGVRRQTEECVQSVGGDSLPDEAKSGGIGETSVVVADMGDFGGEV